MSTFSPVCSAGGKIEKLLLFCTCTTSENPGEVWKQYAGLIAALGPEVEFYILIQLPNTCRNVQLENPAPNVQLIPMEPATLQNEFPLTRWAQDVVHAFQRPGKNGEKNIRFLYDHSRIDSKTLRCLEDKLGRIELRSYKDKQISGGNIILTGKNQEYALIGADMLRWQLKGLSPVQRKTERRSFETRLKKMLGVKQIYWLQQTAASGSVQGKQMLFHIDLFVTAAGTWNDEQLLLVGEIKPEYVFDQGNTRVTEMAAALDRTAAWLANNRNHRGLRCKVVRVPLLVFDSHYEHYGYFNNGLTEQTDTHRHLYLPDFLPDVVQEPQYTRIYHRIKAIQDQLASDFEKQRLGEIRFVNGNFYALSRKMGSLRCMVKVIQRKAA